MQRLLNLLLAGMLTCTALSSGESEVFVVIVNKSNKIYELSPSRIKLIFLRKISRWPWGAEISPVDLPDKNPARQAFAKAIMQSTPDQLDVYWIEQRVSRGLESPPRAANVEAARALVAANPGAVAYIPASDLNDTIRVLQVR